MTRRAELATLNLPDFGLPLSNIPAYLPPFLLAPRRAMRMTGA
jgi:hypothetical protein